MKIIVLQKEVPDTYGERRLDLETGLAVRVPADSVADEIGERALEVALAHADRDASTEVVVLTMGPASVEANVLRKALGTGAHRAVHVRDDALLGADLALTARVLAAAIERIGFDLVVAGNLSTDGTAGVLPAMLAELLGVPLASSLASVQIGDGVVGGSRTLEQGTEEVSAALPAVIAITEALPAARFANFKGILGAKKKPLDSWGLTDLGLEASDAGTARSIVISVAERPARSAGRTIVDDGTAGQQLADFLVENRLA